MAADPEGREFKFYSQFQAEHGNKQNPFEGDNWSSYYGRSDSFLSFSSKVESEIESDKDDGGSGGGDDDDYTAELSRRMAQYMLQDDDNSSIESFQPEIQHKVLNLVRSGRDFRAFVKFLVPLFSLFCGCLLFWVAMGFV